MANLLANKIKDKIQEKGLSINGLEKMAGLKQSSVQNIIRGRSKKPSIDIVQSIAKVLNCTVEELISDHPLSNNLDYSTPSQNIVRDEINDFFRANWDLKLYKAAFEAILKLIENENDITREQLIFLVDEVYKYSWPLKKIDKHFALWLLQNRLTL